MSNLPSQIEDVSRALEELLIKGDLSKLTLEQRVVYYNKVCKDLGVNPFFKPFEYIRLNGKEVLYATRNCTDQLRTIHNVSLMITSRDTFDGIYVVTARATLGNRSDESTGAVSIKGLQGDSLANAFMKAETKAKRRVTLSVCGLGLLDETEVASIPNGEHTHPATQAPTQRAVSEHIASDAELAMHRESPLYQTPNPDLKRIEDTTFDFGGFKDSSIDDDYVIPFGKLGKGKKFSELDVATLRKIKWGSELGIQNRSEWVDKVGKDNVLETIQRLEEYLRDKGQE